MVFHGQSRRAGNGAQRPCPGRVMLLSSRRGFGSRHPFRSGHSRREMAVPTWTSQRLVEVARRRRCAARRADAHLTGELVCHNRMAA
jgi:hypothetical protein